MEIFSKSELFSLCYFPTCGSIAVEIRWPPRRADLGTFMTKKLPITVLALALSAILVGTAFADCPMARRSFHEHPSPCCPEQSTPASSLHDKACPVCIAAVPQPLVNGIPADHFFKLRVDLPESTQFLQIRFAPIKVTRSGADLPTESVELYKRIHLFLI